MNWELISVGCNLVGTIILVFFPYAAREYDDDGGEVENLVTEGNGKKISKTRLRLYKFAPRIGFLLLMVGSGIQFSILLCK
jgi:hypothetical protein